MPVVANVHPEFHSDSEVNIFQSDSLVSSCYTAVAGTVAVWSLRKNYKQFL